MKKKYILAAILFLSIIFSSRLSNGIHDIVQVKAVFNNQTELKNILKESDTFVIKGYIPYTKYEKLNESVQNIVNEYIIQFNDAINGIVPPVEGQKFTLEFTFDEYEYNDYITFVIRPYMDTAGAHPNTYISAVTYNIKKDEIVNIEILNKDYPNLIRKLSEISYEKLKNNEIIKEVDALDMLEDGTKAILDNFRNFAFTKEGFKIFFEKYQVAPYVAGEFEITIPYEELGIKITN